MNKAQAQALAQTVVNSAGRTGWRFNSYYDYQDELGIGVTVENTRTDEFETLLSREDWKDLTGK